MPKHKLIAILGPTAVGKTALAVKLAEKFATEIISGDSMLVYKHFDIGTAKPTAAERGGVKHHLIDISEPRENYHVADFVQSAQKIIADLNARGKIPILAGGTGLYAKALVEGYNFAASGICEEYRRKLAALAAEKGKDFLLAKLRETDPQAADKLSGGDVRRIIRALEIARGGEKVFGGSFMETNGALAYDAFVAGIFMRRENLYARINERVTKMIDAGLVDETRELIACGFLDTNAMKAIGYRETAAYLAGTLARENLVGEIQKSTRHFAKRQLTWYKKMPYIRRFFADECTEDELLEHIFNEAAGYFGFSENNFTKPQRN